MYNADFLAWLLASIFGFIPALRPVLRTAIAYPLNARFRTGMTMILFAMIMATVVVMAVVIHATQSLVRQDIRSSFGSSTTTAQGVPLTIKLTVKDLATSSALVGAADDVWHGDRDGRSSMYSQGAAARIG